MGFTKLLAPLTIHRERSHRIVLHGLPQFGDEEPALLVKYAGSGNRGYERGVRAVQEQLETHPNGPNKATLQRQLIAPIFAEHVVTGWEGIYEDDGNGGVKPATFSLDSCKALLSELADDHDRADVFWLLNQASNANNFRDPLPKPSAVGKG